MFLIYPHQSKRTIKKSNNFWSAINPRTGYTIYADSETELQMMLKDGPSTKKTYRASGWF